MDPAPLEHDWLHDSIGCGPVNGMSPEEAAAVANRVMLHLYRGSIDLAREALEAGWETHRELTAPLPVGEALLDVHLSQVLIDQRLLNMLEDRGVRTVRDLLKPRGKLADFGTARTAQIATVIAGLRIRAGLDSANCG